jgi:hypothetical protein
MSDHPDGNKSKSLEAIPPGFSPIPRSNPPFFTGREPPTRLKSSHGKEDHARFKTARIHDGSACHSLDRAKLSGPAGEQASQPAKCSGVGAFRAATMPMQTTRVSKPKSQGPRNQAQFARHGQSYHVDLGAPTPRAPVLPLHLVFVQGVGGYEGCCSVIAALIGLTAG